MFTSNKKNSYIGILLFLFCHYQHHCKETGNNTQNHQFNEHGNLTRVDNARGERRNTISSKNRTEASANIGNTSIITSPNKGIQEGNDGNIVFYKNETETVKKSQAKPSQLLLKSTANASSSLPTVGDGLDLGSCHRMKCGKHRRQFNDGSQMTKGKRRREMLVQCMQTGLNLICTYCGNTPISLSFGRLTVVVAKASIIPKRSSPSIVPSCVGNQVTLKCAAEGNPAPDFTWYKGRQLVSKDKVAEFDLNIAPSLFTRASHLTFTPSRKDDFGDYECAASNTLGASQQSIYKIKLTDKGKVVCTESANNKEMKKYHSIIIGTVTTVAILLVILFVAGFVFWRLNQQEAEAYQSLANTEKSSSYDEASIEHNAQPSTSGKQDHKSSAKNETDEDAIQDDFNAKEIGRLSALLAGDWEKLARLLGFHQHDVTAIRQDSDKVESRCADMLNRFRRRHGSRETLAESVEEINDVETAMAIRQKYYQSNPTE